jgi:hypothetical protein
MNFMRLVLYTLATFARKSPEVQTELGSAKNLARILDFLIPVPVGFLPRSSALL